MEYKLGAVIGNVATRNNVYDTYYNFCMTDKPGTSVVSFEDACDSSILYIVAHGNEHKWFKGQVVVDGGTCSIKALLKNIYKNYFKTYGCKMPYKKVYTISCLGGYQKPKTYKGIVIESIHNSKNKIYVEATTNVFNNLVDFTIKEILN